MKKYTVILMMVGMIIGGVTVVGNGILDAQTKNADSQKTDSRAPHSRKEMMRTLATSNPAQFLAEAMPESAKAKLPADVQKDIETHVSLTGTLDVIQVDDFENTGKERVEYVFKTGKERLTLEPVGKLDTRSGGTWRVNGVRLDNLLVAHTAQITSLQAPREVASTGEQRTLIMLLDYSNATPHPFSAAQIADRVFNGPIQQFYKEQSYGKVRFTGTALGWFHLNRPDDCRAYNIGSQEFQDLVSRNNIDLGQFDRLVIAANGPCALSGMGTIGVSSVTVNGKTYSMSIAWVSGKPDTLSIKWGQSPFEWTFWDYTTAHELGHNLGAYHANGWDCGEETFAGNCQHIEYFNFFDTMGRGTYSLHFNAFTKEALGWMTANDTLKITKSGRYTIVPLIAPVPEVIPFGVAAAAAPVPSSASTALSARAPAKKFAKIQTTAGVTPFYLEYRKGAGFDRNLSSDTLASNQEGLFVNWISNTSGTGDPSVRLLDIQPTSDEWVVDMHAATLNQSVSTKSPAVFQDEGRGITIGPIVSHDNASITFDVTVAAPSCTRRDPSFTLLENPVPNVAPGSTAGYLIVHFNNPDSVGCGVSSFEISSNIPASWKPLVLPPGNISLPPAVAGQNDIARLISFTVPANAVGGSEQAISVSVKNIASGRETSRSTTIHIIGVPHITSVDPSTVPMGSTAVLSGSDLASSPVVLLSGATGSAWITPTNVSNTSLTISIPSTLTGYACACSIPTPVGTYGVLVFANGAVSEQLEIEVVAAQAEQATSKVELKEGQSALSDMVAGAVVAYLAMVGKVVGFTDY